MALVKYNNNSLSSVTSAAGFPAGAMTLIKTLTASSSSTLSFVDGSSDVVLDNTYPIYLFKFINIHGSNDDENLQFNLSVDTGSNYNVTKTTTKFDARADEADSSTALAYDTGRDLAQSTSNQNLMDRVGSDNDQSVSGELFLFNPSSTIFVKHFIARSQAARANDQTKDSFVSGYGNTTSAIDAVKFVMSAGNIDSGTIKLYGIKDS